MIRTSLYSIALLLLLTQLASAELISIRAFTENKSKWNDLVGAELHLEGRYGVISDGEMSFRNCTMRFLLRPDVHRPITDSGVVKVVGHLIRKDGKLVFEVLSLGSLPDDMETLISRQATLQSNQPQGWFELADWAEERGDFYNDQELLKEAKNLRMDGIRKKKSALPSGATVALIKLADEAKRMQLADTFILELIHESLRNRYLQVKKQSQPYAPLLDDIAKQLPSATKSLVEVPPFVDDYLKSPVTYYNASDEKVRPILHRIFYMNVMLERIESEADENGKNAKTIAARIAENVPERMDLAKKYEELALQYERSRVPSMTMQQLLDLADVFEQRGEPETVKEIKVEWLNSRERLLGQDARGYAELAQEWLILLDDRETAKKFFVAAWKEEPQYETAIEWLKSNGYLLIGGRWIPKSQAPNTDEARMAIAIQEGRVITGMTSTQARQAMGAIPDSVLRIATSGKITELWVYETGGVMLRLARRDRLETAIVVAIDPIK